MEIEVAWPGSRKNRQHDAHTKREALAPLKADLRWLQKRINAASDPVTLRYIADIKARIAAVERRGRP
jgi:hypothetical protein